MKLNLGCGPDIKEGYVNVDNRQTHPSVRISDLSILPWEFETESADEILMLDFLEHFPVNQTEKILRECFRVLKRKGKLVVQVPDFDHLARAILHYEPFKCHNCGYTFNEKRLECENCKVNVLEIKNAAVKRLFGGQDYPGNFHQTTFTKLLLNIQVENIGFKFIEWQEKEHQNANWNFKGLWMKL